MTVFGNQVEGDVQTEALVADFNACVSHVDVYERQITAELWESPKRETFKGLVLDDSPERT